MIETSRPSTLHNVSQQVLIHTRLFITELQTFSECYAMNGVRRALLPCSSQASNRARENPTFSNYYCK